MRISSGQVDTGTFVVSYIEAGTGPLVIFAHGTFGAKESFIPQMELLYEICRCVSIDLPGHGDSGYLTQGWGVADIVNAIPALIAELGEARATLAGLSQGGAIFMRAALAFPDLVAALIIMCAGPGTPAEAMLEKMRRFARLLQQERDEAVRLCAAHAFAIEFHAPGFAARHPDALEREAASMISHPRTAMPLVAEVPASYVSVADQLDGIRCPTLILWGEEDFRPGYGRELAALIPGAELQTIPNAGHHINVDAPTSVGRAIKDYLARGLNDVS